MSLAAQAVCFGIDPQPYLRARTSSEKRVQGEILAWGLEMRDELEEARIKAGGNA